MTICTWRLTIYIRTYMLRSLHITIMQVNNYSLGGVDQKKNLNFATVSIVDHHIALKIRILVFFSNSLLSNTSSSLLPPLMLLASRSMFPLCNRPDYWVPGTKLEISTKIQCSQMMQPYVKCHSSCVAS